MINMILSTRGAMRDTVRPDQPPQREGVHKKPPQNEADHFILCPARGGWIDCRDLGQVFEHQGRYRTLRRINRNEEKTTRRAIRNPG